MDGVSLIFIAIAILVGIAIGWSIFGRKKGGEFIVMEENHSETENLQQQLKESEDKARSIKQQYEKLLSEAKEQTRVVDEKLKAVIEGGPDEAIRQQLAEVDKLKKKIKNLEDENEEFEDDLDACKKKLKNKEVENSKLHDELDISLREKNGLQNELQKAADELEDKAHELNLKTESLSFVQEILTAKRTDDESVAKLYTKIDSLSDFICGELKDTIFSILRVEYEMMVEFENNYDFFGSGHERWAVAARKSWIQGKTTIAFVGEFSAGKTSIVNRILSQDDPKVPLLPVSTKATTAIPTYISGGVGTFYQFVTPNNELKSISEGTFKKVSKEVLDQVNGVSSLIQYFVMTYKNPNLNKLSILDTPGFNSNDKEDAERTIGVINECDALFWVFDVNAGTVNRSSIELIKKHLKKPLYVVINKVDTKAKTEVDQVENLIRKTLSDAGLSVKSFIRFSSKAPLNDIMKPIASVTHNDDRENYLGRLSELVSYWTAEREKEVINAKKKADDLLKTSNELVDQFNISIGNLNDHCVAVSEIPNYTTHDIMFWKDDNFEMSEQEYSEMVNLLQKICEQDCDMLCNLYNQQMETRAELQEAWAIHANEREQWQRLNQCNEILKKKINELKK